MKLLAKLLLMILVSIGQQNQIVTENRIESKQTDIRLREIVRFYQDYLDYVTNSIIYSNNSTVFGKKKPSPMLRNPLSSFNIIMNFNFDGTMGLLMMDGTHREIYRDSGHCPHGYMYDPISNLCRQIFCIDGFELKHNDNKCIPNENATFAAVDKNIRMKFDLNILNDYVHCSREDGQVSCDMSFLGMLISDFVESFDVNTERFKDIVVLRQDFYDFNKSDFDWDLVNATLEGLGDLNRAQKLQIALTISDTSVANGKVVCFN